MGTLMHAVMQHEPLGLHLVFDRAETLFAHRRVREGGQTAEKTYSGMFAEARHLSGQLTGLGLLPGEVVGTFGWNTMEHLIAYIAVPGTGLALHTINIKLSADQIAYTLEHAGDRVVLVDAALWQLWSKVTVPPCVEHVLVYGDTAELPTWQDGAAVTRLQDVPCPQPRVGVWYRPEDENEASGICYTSGTTGSPKSVVYSHRSVYLHALTLCGADTFAISHHDVVCPVVPMFHANSWNLPYAALLTGAGLVLPGARTDPARLARCCADGEVTFSAAVPTIWTNLVAAVHAGEVAKNALVTLRRVVIGGSAASQTLLDELSDLGVEPIHAWGMTESSPVGLVANPPTGADSVTTAESKISQGRPMPALAVVNADDEGQPLAWDGQALGELRISGPYVVSEYYHAEPEVQQDKFADQAGRRWLRTGDVVMINKHGFVRLVDRTKDLVKSGGEWISSVELENHLLAHPTVREAAVVAIPDATWGERPLAVVASSIEVSASTLREFLTARVPRWQVPDRFEFVTEVPKTSVGKLDKKHLRTRYT